VLAGVCSELRTRCEHSTPIAATVEHTPERNIGLHTTDVGPTKSGTALFPLAGASKKVMQLSVTLQQNTTLTSLEFSSCFFHFEGLRQVASAFKTNQTLRSLSIGPLQDISVDSVFGTGSVFSVRVLSGVEDGVKSILSSLAQNSNTVGCNVLSQP